MTIGERVRMIDARERVTGRVDYVLNFQLRGMLVGKILHSPHPHARVLKVDTSRAEALPGVIAVLSRNDLLDHDADVGHRSEEHLVTRPYTLYSRRHSRHFDMIDEVGSEPLRDCLEVVTIDDLFVEQSPSLTQVVGHCRSLFFHRRCIRCAAFDG